MKLNLSHIGILTYRREMLAGIVNSCFVGAGALLPVLLKKHFDASLLQLSIFASVNSIAFLSSIWVNRWTERISARKIILYGGLVRAALFSLLSLVHTPIGLIMLYGLMQLTFAALHPALSRLWKANYAENERMQVTGVITAVRSLFEMALAYSITTVVDWHVETFRFILPLAGVAGAVAHYIIASIPMQGGDDEDVPDRAQEDRFVLVEYLHVLRNNKTLTFFLFLFFFYGIGNWIHQVLQVAYLEELLGLSYAQFSVLLFIIPQFITILCYPLLSRLITRYGIFRSYLLFCILDVIYYGLMWYGADLVVFSIAKAIKGIAQGGTMLLWLIGVLQFGETKAEIRRYAAIHLTLTGARALIGPAIGFGFATWFGINSIFAVSGCCSSIALISLAVYFCRNNPPSVTQ